MSAVHDRVHARPPHDPENWRVGTITALDERDGHAVFVVAPEDIDGASDAVSDADDTIDLVVTLDIRDLVLRRLDGDEPVGQRVWFRRKGANG